MGTRNTVLSRLKVEEEDVEITFFTLKEFNTPTSWDITGKGAGKLSDQRYTQLREFAIATFNLYIEAYNKPESK